MRDRRGRAANRRGCQKGQGKRGGLKEGTHQCEPRGEMRKKSRVNQKH